jgi:hypothetical protein
LYYKDTEVFGAGSAVSYKKKAMKSNFKDDSPSSLNFFFGYFR